VSGLIAAQPGSAWSYGASILTFLFPMLLFIAVAGALYVLYTKPQPVPGSRYAERAVGATPQVRSGGPNVPEPQHAAPAGGQSAPSAVSQPTAASGDGEQAAAGGADE
jgi:hypothetical protein